MLKRIEIEKKVGFEELCDRLRNVELRGFQTDEEKGVEGICVYEDADFKVRKYVPEEIKANIMTPQPSIYQDHLDRIEIMRALFLDEGIDISMLECGYDYAAWDDEGKETGWTILPPVVERVFVPTSDGKVDYNRMLSEELKERLKEEGVELGELGMKYSDLLCDNICDGSHRIHANVLGGRKQTLLVIDGIKEGWPYYALPQDYSVVHVEPERIEDQLDKIHILPEPHHKMMYRLFPTGGIFSGDVRSKVE